MAATRSDEAEGGDGKDEGDDDDEDEMRKKREVEQTRPVVDKGQKIVAGAIEGRNLLEEVVREVARHVEGLEGTWAVASEGPVVDIEEILGGGKRGRGG